MLHHVRRTAPMGVLILTLSAGIGCPAASSPEFEAEPSFDPPTMFLTWQDDPTTTMTVQWLADKADPAIDTVWYAPKAAGDWHAAMVTRHPFPLSTLHVYRAQLDGLEPGTEYRFNLGGVSPTFRFRTAPANLDEPIRFVAGGDASPRQATARTNTQAARHDPLFALIGGDIAYGDGKKVNAWVGFLALWRKHMIAPDGRLIPLLVSIGNHEVAGGWDKTKNEATLFYSLFGLFKNRGYNVIDFGDYMSVIMLNSGHTEAIAGAQTGWLERTLDERRDVPHKFVIYHVPSYPSHRRYNGSTSPATRQYWVPLFDQYGVDVVFENHDHTYKRSPKLRGGRPDPDGVLYLGDGCWGVRPRGVKTAADTWYIQRSASVNHFILTTLDGPRRHHTAIDNTGRVIDIYPTPRIAIELPSQQPHAVHNVFPNGKPIQVEVVIQDTGDYGRSVAQVTGQLVLESEAGGRLQTLGTFSSADPASLHTQVELPIGKYQLYASGTVTFADGSADQVFVGLGARRFQVFDTTPRDAEQVDGLVAGLDYRYYEGKWGALPDFQTLQPVAEGHTEVFGLGVPHRNDHFALVFAGYIEVATEGPYQFFTTSDDGSRLYIGSTRVVENDGLHAPVERSGPIVLKAGRHPITVTFFERGSGEALEVSYRGPGVDKQPIPAHVLFRRDEP